MTTSHHKRIPAVSWTWDEGHFWDLWMVVHLISGAILGIIIGLFDFSLFVGMTIAVLLMIVWELFEVTIGVHEVAKNRVLDLMIGVIGYLAVFYFLPDDQDTVFIILIILAVILAILEFLGWRAYQQRTGGKTPQV